MANERPQKLNIYHLLDLAPSLENLEPKDTNPSFVLEKEDLVNPFKYRLFIQRNAPGSPNWHKLFQPILQPESEPIRTLSASFILFVSFQAKTYALTGGYGHSKIPKEYIDDDFGIHMAKRLINPDGGITSLTQKAMKGPTRQIHRAFIGYRPRLDLENYNRLLKAIEGKSIDSEFCLQITGKASLSFSKKVAFGDLPGVFQRIEGIYSNEPVVDFPDTFEIINALPEINRLNNLLTKELNNVLDGSGDVDRLYLEFSDLILQFQCEHFFIRTSRKNQPIDFFTIQNVCGAIRQLGINTLQDIEDLKKIKVIGTNEQGHPIIDKEPLINFIVFELDSDGTSYLYSGKKWYKIFEDFKNYIDQEVSAIELKNDLPDWDNSRLEEPKGEKQYNEYAAREKSWKNLDRQCISTQGATKVEVCDLCDPSTKRLIHVKKVWGAKTSYLFSQGIISGESLYQSPDFRKACSEKWPSLFEETFRRDREITFAIADNRALASTFPKNMSYFAKLNLVEVTSRLKSLGYRVSLSSIQILD